MKIQSTQKKKYSKIIFGIAIVIVVGIVTAGSLWVWNHFNATETTNDPKIDLQEPTADQKTAGESIKEDSVNQSTGDGNRTGSDPLPLPVPGENGQLSTVDAQITSANVSGSNLIIRSLIQTITSSGTCSLNLTSSSGKVYTASSEVQALPNGTTCKGFDIPLSELGTGQWTITLNFANNSIKAQTTQTVTL